MIPPEEFYKYREEVNRIYARYNQAMTNALCRKIAKHGAEWENGAYYINESAADDAYNLMMECVTENAYIKGEANMDVSNLFFAVASASLYFDARALKSAGIEANTVLTAPMISVTQSRLEMMIRTSDNILNMSAVNASERYKQIVSQATQKIVTGAETYTTAISTAIYECADVGAEVYFQSGRRMSIEAAARMHIMTGVNQVVREITDMNCEDLGAEYVEVSAHHGARPTHAAWQGEVYKIHGSDADYDNLYDVTELGSGDGLCGWNCRHSYAPFFPDRSTRAYTQETLDRYNEKTCEYNGGELTDYEASQIQRRYERAIRDSKRKVGALEESIRSSTDPKLTAELQHNLERANQTYRNRRDRLTDFCSQTGREKDYLRMRIPG